MAGKEISSNYSFYETPGWIAGLMAENISVKGSIRVLDLGAGCGALLRGISKKYSKSKCVAVELDKNHNKNLEDLSNEVHNLNILEKGLPKSIVDGKESRVIVSNPPFGKAILTKESIKILSKAGFVDKNTIAKSSRKELIFLAQAISISQKGTELAFIVPSAFLNNRHWSRARKVISGEHNLKKIILLPKNAFKGAEVETVMLFITAFESPNEIIDLDDYRGRNRKKCELSRINFLNAEREMSKEDSGSNLGQWVEEIARGKSCAKELRHKKIRHLHSSDIRNYNKQELYLTDEMDFLDVNNQQVVIPGDILISRVGSRCLGSVAIVKSGKTVISDSIITIRVQENKRKRIFNMLISDFGQNWLQSKSTGSCAKIITYKMLEYFPLRLA